MELIFEYPLNGKVKNLKVKEAMTQLSLVKDT
jgi:hypothetical protein